MYKTKNLLNDTPLAIIRSSRNSADDLVRSQKFEVPEGSSRSRQVVVEFPDYASALACYHSPEYQTNKKTASP